MPDKRRNATNESALDGDFSSWPRSEGTVGRLAQHAPPSKFESRKSVSLLPLLTGKKARTFKEAGSVVEDGRGRVQLEVGERLNLGCLPALPGDVLDGEHVVREGSTKEERSIGQGGRGRSLGDREEGGLKTGEGGGKGGCGGSAKCQSGSDQG